MVGTDTQILVDELHKKTGFSVCFITAILALSYPARSALKVFLQQQRSLLELKVNKLAFQIQRNNMLSEKFNNLFVAVSNKLGAVKNIINVTHFGDTVENCPELQELLRSIIKGAGVSGLKIEGFDDIDDLLSEIHYRLNSANAALNLSTRAQQQLTARLALLDKWLELLNVM